MAGIADNSGKHTVTKKDINEEDQSGAKDDNCESKVPVKAGKIKLFIGPMFASKTSSMISEVERYLITKKKCMIIKHAQDTRYDHYSKGVPIVTHSGKIFDKCPIVTVGLLKTANEKFAESLHHSDVIAISEGQFYDDVSEYANKWANEGKIVIVEALNGDFRQKPFDNVVNLMSVSDTVVHLKAICMVCYENDASFTIRTNKNEERIVIGNENIYMAVCRQCKINTLEM